MTSNRVDIIELDTPEGVPENSEYFPSEKEPPDNAQVHESPYGGTYVTYPDDSTTDEQNGESSGFGGYDNEASDEVSKKSPKIVDLDDKLVKKQGITDMSSFAALSSQTPDPTREPVEREIYQVTNPDKLPEDAKSSRRLLFSNGDTEIVMNGLVADTPSKRYTGLSRKESLSQDTAMMFNWETVGINSLVMRDMNFPLDVLFLDSEGYIKKTYEKVHPRKSKRMKAVCQYAVEAPAGFVERNNLDKSYRVYISIDSTLGKQDDIDTGIVFIDRVSEAPEDTIVHVSPRTKEMYYVKKNINKAEIADKYLDDTGLSEDDFVPNQDVKDVVDNVLEFIDKHGLINPDNQQEGSTRANQLQNYAEDNEPLAYDYWEEIYNYHKRSRAQDSHICDESSLPAEAEEINQNKFDPCLFDAGYFSDQTWGSDAAFEQAEKIVTAVEDADVET